MAHTATTSISRYFNLNRGKALSATWLGTFLAEFIMPITIVFFLSIYLEKYMDINSFINYFIFTILSFFTIKNINFFTRKE